MRHNGVHAFGVARVEFARRVHNPVKLDRHYMPVRNNICGHAEIARGGTHSRRYFIRVAVDIAPLARSAYGVKLGYVHRTVRLARYKRIATKNLFARITARGFGILSKLKFALAFRDQRNRILGGIFGKRFDQPIGVKPTARKPIRMRGVRPLYVAPPSVGRNNRDAHDVLAVRPIDINAVRVVERHASERRAIARRLDDNTVAARHRLRHSVHRQRNFIFASRLGRELEHAERARNNAVDAPLVNGSGVSPVHNLARIKRHCGKIPVGLYKIAGIFDARLRFAIDLDDAFRKQIARLRRDRIFAYADRRKF